VSTAAADTYDVDDVWNEAVVTSESEHVADVVEHADARECSVHRPTCPLVDT